DPAIYANTALATAIASSYDFGQLTAGVNEQTTGANIVVKAHNALASDTRLNVTANTNVRGSGDLDFLTNGNIDITETTGDVRIKTIQSNAGDVSLEAAAGSIYETANGTTDNGTTAWVIGTNLTLRAPLKAIGVGPADLLEINSSANGTDGKVDAFA